MPPVPAGYTIEIEQLSGPLILGYLLHWGLFGTLSVQLYLYYLAFPKDRQFIKHLVYGIYIVEFVQMILVAHGAFEVFGYGFDDLAALIEVNFDGLIVPIMVAIAASVGQGFYAYRIFILSGSRIFPALVVWVSLTSAVAAIFGGICTFQAGDTTKLIDRKVFISVGIWCGGSVLCDIVIAICMTYYLLRSNTGFRRTQILVTKLICLIIKTGSLTAVIALVTFILFFAFPHQAYYRTPAVITSKLYANTIYMVLNSRIQIMDGRDTYTSSTDMEITTTMVRDITSHPTQGTLRTPVVATTAEVSISGDEMGRMSKPQNGDMSSPPRVTD